MLTSRTERAREIQSSNVPVTVHKQGIKQNLKLMEGHKPSNEAELLVAPGVAKSHPTAM